MNRISLLVLLLVAATLYACEKKSSANVDISTPDGAGLKIAYINSDSVLNNFETFKEHKVSMEARQKKAEDDLMKKGAAIEREFMTYQQQAQKGTMTGKEMEAREKYLTGRQEALMAERDKAAREIMEETSMINERLQKVLQDRLKEIKEKEGYDFILSYVAGGPILIADEKYDITEQVLTELNKTTSEKDPADITKNN